MQIKQAFIYFFLNIYSIPKNNKFAVYLADLLILTYLYKLPFWCF